MPELIIFHLSVIYRICASPSRPCVFGLRMICQLSIEPAIILWLQILCRGFNARFSCKGRTYRYFFSASEHFDIARMREAAEKLVGIHDFRNFCKMDVVNVSSFEREIRSVSIAPSGPLYYLEISANGFLYHQIRCTMTVLQMVAMGQEEPQIVDALLDVHSLTRKPCYPLAEDAPLVLWECQYSPEDVQWRTEPQAAAALLREFAALSETHAIRSSVALAMETTYGEEYARESGQVTRACEPAQHPHVKLLVRPRENSIDRPPLSAPS